MTQAFNLAQFANTLNSSGQTSNSGLQNSAITVTAGTGLSGGGSVALGSSVTLANAGVTSLTAGTNISISASTGGVTISSTALTGSTSQLARAWVSFNSSGSILKSYNVSSITSRGTGQWTVNFTSSLPDGNYAMTAATAYGPVYPNSGGNFVNFNWDGSNGVAPTASNCQINTTRGTYNGSDGVYFNSALTSCTFFD